MILSVQEGEAQIPEEQIPLVQSVPDLQTLESAHLGQDPPPQSMSVSQPL